MLSNERSILRECRRWTLQELCRHPKASVLAMSKTWLLGSPVYHMIWGHNYCMLSVPRWDISLSLRWTRRHYWCYCIDEMIHLRSHDLSQTLPKGSQRRLKKVMSMIRMCLKGKAWMLGSEHILRDEWRTANYINWKSSPFHWIFVSSLMKTINKRRRGFQLGCFEGQSYIVHLTESLW